MCHTVPNIRFVTNMTHATGHSGTQNRQESQEDRDLDHQPMMQNNCTGVTTTQPKQ